MSMKTKPRKSKRTPLFQRGGEYLSSQKALKEIVSDTQMEGGSLVVSHCPPSLKRWLEADAKRRKYSVVFENDDGRIEYFITTREDARLRREHDALAWENAEDYRNYPG